MPGGVLPLPVEIGIADIVALDIVYAPLGIELKDRVVVCLPGLALPQAVHIRIPAADGRGVRRHISSHVGAQDGQMLMGCFPGNASHDVDAEFQAQGVDLIRQRLEAGSSRTGGELDGAGKEPSVAIHLIAAKGDVLKFIPHGGSIVGVPLDVHHDVFPAVGLQMLCHVFCVGKDLRFGDVGIVVVVAVPAHRGPGCEAILVHQIPPISFNITKDPIFCKSRPEGVWGR